jgi:F0F1-type ATP synthase membrane subunit c/vacuolar-type H+-ATPase subunit K
VPDGDWFGTYRMGDRSLRCVSVFGETPSDDPGWSDAWRLLPWLLVPGLAIRRIYRKGDGKYDGLVILRQLFVVFAVAMILVGAVVIVLVAFTRQPRNHPLPNGAVAVGVALVGGASVSASRLVARLLVCTDASALAGSYRTRFFLQIAFSEAAALVGFVGFMITWTGWVYPVGLAISIVGLALMAPTKGHLAGDQERLRACGCFTPLLQSLRSNMPPPPAGRPRR